MRVRAPKAAAKAKAGTFAHISCDLGVPLRRPLSIMHADAKQAWIEFLYKPVGEGLARLARRQAGEVVNLIAPIGNGFAADPDRPRVLAIGGGVGIPPMLFLAQQLRGDDRYRPCVLMGSEIPFPFEITESAMPLPGMPPDATHAMALLEQWGIPSRLASQASLPGSHAGYVTDLARAHLDAVGDPADVQIVACGPEPMLAAVARLAARFGLPCQLALEEFMACGVGGCAGCTVLLQTGEGPAMKRVCVDGPVFEAREVYPASFSISRN